MDGEQRLALLHPITHLFVNDDADRVIDRIRLLRPTRTQDDRRFAYAASIDHGHDSSSSRFGHFDDPCPPQFGGIVHIADISALRCHQHPKLFKRGAIR